MPPTLRLDQFAELSARMTGGEKRSDVLASAGVEPDRWEATQEFWMGKMAEDAGKGRFVLSQKYSALYQAAASRLAAATAIAGRAVKRVAPVEAHKVVVHAAPAVPTGPVSARPSAPPLSAPPPSLPVASVPAPSIAVGSVPPPASVPARTAHVARLTLEQLAAMRAEMATSPEAEHDAVRDRFGLDSSHLGARGSPLAAGARLRQGAVRALPQTVPVLPLLAPAPMKTRPSPLPARVVRTGDAPGFAARCRGGHYGWSAGS